MPDDNQSGINFNLLNVQAPKTGVVAQAPPANTTNNSTDSLLGGLSNLVKGIGGFLNKTPTAQQGAVNINPNTAINALNNPAQGSRLNQDIGATLLGNAQQELGMRAADTTLQSYLQKANPGLDPTKTPWCAGFVGSVLNASGLKGTGSLAAKSYLQFGTPTTKPQKGDIVVFNDLTGRNDPAHGHVGFYAGTDANGNIITIGGNQGGGVSTQVYPSSMVAGFRVPPDAQQIQQFAQKQGIQNPQQLSQVPNQINNAAQVNSLSIQNIVKAAKATYPNDPNMAKLAAAQAVQESGLSSGQPSQLAMKNNLFGIKGAGTAGSVIMPTTEYMNGQPRRIPAGFATNRSVDDSFQQYAHVMSLPRYQKVQDANSFEEAAKEVQQAGYATDPNYSKNLINVFNTQLAPYFEDNSSGPKEQMAMNSQPKEINTNEVNPPLIDHQNYEDIVRQLDQGRDDYSQINNNLNQLLG